MNLELRNRIKNTISSMNFLAKEHQNDEIEDFLSFVYNQYDEFLNINHLYMYLFRKQNNYYFHPTH